VGIARRWVFPIIWMVIFAVIGAALVKIAFFPDVADAGSDGLEPTGQIIEPQVPVTLGTIRNDVVLDGTISADPAVPARAAISGEVRKVSATAGQHVDEGAELAQIRGMNDDGSNRWSILRAPRSGTLASFDLLVGQQVSLGEALAQIAPPTFSVTATLAPEQRYRLLQQPTEAEVAINGGPAPFTCTGLTITTAPPVSGGGDGEGGGQGGSGTTVSCAVPGDVQVFSGLTAKVTIAGGIAENVLTLPLTAVEGAAGTGVVYLIGTDGEPVETPVTLGLNDGVNVEIKDGVAEGDIVLQFVPGAPANPEMPTDGGVVFLEG
jgi:multidrug efflux pump subunit AcrA (membrane-fusion protein)